jgi:hypothetical protein
MTLTGGVGAVGIGAIGVGVSVAGTGAAEGAVVAVGGMVVGKLVTLIGMPAGAHPASASMLALMMISNANFFIIYSSLVSYQVIR